MRILSSSNLGAARASFAIACVRRTLVLAAALALLSGAVSCSAWQQDDQSGAQSGSSAEGSRVAAGATRFEYEDNVGGTLFSIDASTAALPASAAGTPPVAIKVSRQAALDSAQRGTMAVELPDGTRYPVRYESSKNAPRGNWTFVGRVDTPLGALAAVITFGKDSVFGTLPGPDGRMMQLTTSAGQALLKPAGGIVPPWQSAATAPSDALLLAGSGPSRKSIGVARHAAADAVGAGHSSTMPAPAGTETRIDVLGIYTSNLATVRGSVSAAESELVNVIAVANQAHIDSGTTARLNLVEMLEVDYPADAFNQAALYDLSSNTLPDGQDIHALRNQLGADLVAMLRPAVQGDDNCGIAWLAGGGLYAATPHADNGYSVSATVDCGALVMAHEIGHNLGSQHDRDSAAGYGAYDYSFGYRRSNPDFGTVMAYLQPGQSWLGYFSHAGTTLCSGVACGRAGEQDNARSINQMAPRIARYRDPWATISVHDSSIIERVVGTIVAPVLVRSSSPAPAGGILFDVRDAGAGTATPGSDYLPFAATDVLIPQGAHEALIQVEVNADELVEGDETILLEIHNVRGMPLHDSLGEVTIFDDDPRSVLHGQVVFPAGSMPPSEGFFVHVDSFQDGHEEPTSSHVQPPDFRFEARVPPGARVMLDPDLPFPFLAPRVDLGKLAGDSTHAIDAMQGKQVSGRIRWAGGASPPASDVPVVARGTEGPGTGEIVYARPPDFEYAFAVTPGANIQLNALEPPSPWVPQILELGPVDEDIVVDIEMRTIPSLAVAHAAANEGGAGDVVMHYLDIRLSTPAPEGGVTFDLATVDGTAVAGPQESGADYEALQLDGVVIGEGADSTLVEITTYGDDVTEPDESFQVVLSNVIGAAWVPAPATVHILDDDRRPATSDFDGDGASDLLWRNGQFGQNVAWLGADASTPQSLLGVRDLDWHVAGVGDYDADGQADVFWRHASTGANAVWRSARHDAQLPVVGISSQAWGVAAVGDFNGNGSADLFWRHAGNGANVIWESGNYTTPVAVLTVAGSAWRVAGAGDFDGDGRSDLFWRNQATGANVVWKGADADTTLPTGGLPDLDWVVAGIGDIDGNGRADVIWRHQSSGANVAWLSAEPGQAWVLGAVGDLAWEVQAMGDYNGDGRDDIVWRHRSSGANVVWPSAERASGFPLAGVRDLAWDVVP